MAVPITEESKDESPMPHEASELKAELEDKQREIEELIEECREMRVENQQLKNQVRDTQLQAKKHANATGDDKD